jgi:hypothetical protein
MAIDTLVSNVKTVKEGKNNEPKKFSPEYKLVEDYFNPNPLTTKTCTMSRISKKLSYQH